MPAGASTFSSGIDSLFNFIVWGSTLLFFAIVAITLYFIVKYRRRHAGHNYNGPHVTHNTFLELAWTVPPLILVTIIFYWGFSDFLKMSVAPQNGEEIRVVGKKWLWQFEYKNGTKTLGELVVPVNTPIKLIMSSEDVIHSFYVPNFRIKRDVLPNRYTTQWFQAKRVGNFQVFCTEYCGDGHSEMLASVRVLSHKDYVKWLKEAGSVSPDMPLDQVGEKVYAAKACITCHSIDGSAKTGPTWKGLFGSTRKLVGGTSVVADENYIRESIKNPAAKVVEGFGPVMPPYEGLLSDREIDGVIEYIKKLK